MAIRFFTLSVVLSVFLSVFPSYGEDKVPIRGTWDDEDYRISSALPPVLSIEGCVLSVHFESPLDNLHIQIISTKGQVVYESNISGNAGEITPIVLETMNTGDYYIVLNHKLGWLSGIFTL